MEPVENLTVDIPEGFVGVVMEHVGSRKGEVANMHNLVDACASNSAFPAAG